MFKYIMVLCFLVASISKLQGTQPPPNTTTPHPTVPPPRTVRCVKNGPCKLKLRVG